VINGFSQLLLKTSTPGHPAHHRLEEILKAGERGAGLTQQLLAFSRKQVLQPRIINPGALLQGMDWMLRRLIGENIEAVTSIDEGLAQIKIDPSQFEQVILNLVVNARDAMNREGKLTLELKNVEMNGPTARAHEVPPGRYVMLAVSDNGAGMTPEVRQRVFEPFFTTKDAGKGTGLGLATVYGIVKQSGGFICLYSEPGIGTTFKILMPRVDERPDALPGKPAQEIGRGDETVLVVEDDPSVRSFVQQVLTSEGYTVVAVKGGEEAILTGREYAGEIHLLVTDIVLGKTDGRQVAERLTALRSTMKVLFVSGYTGAAVVHNGILESEAAFLQKPFSPEVLSAKVRSILGGKAVIERVLVVDDERPIRDLLSAILEESGFQVLTAPNGREARIMARQHPIDLVISDLAMEDGEGIEMIGNLRKAYPKLKIIAMSGVFGLDVLSSARVIGASATLTKPLSADAVLRCISSLSDTVSGR
jgi:two-component system, cell cycle sensor histidine kinase and response regulator CckA